MYDVTPGGRQYYTIERCEVPLTERFLHTLGEMRPDGDDPERNYPLQSKQPTWGEPKHAFRFDTYTAACHWLLRWKPQGTHRLVYINEDTTECKYVMDGPVERERFDERDWKEYHHMNGKRN